MSAAQPLHPFADWAKAYLKAGWSPLVLPARRKAPPPEDYTGEAAREITAKTVAEWARATPSGNIAIRMPADVIGIDVDVYDAKRGDETLAALEAEFGELPPTIVTTARGFKLDEPGGLNVHGGIRWYRIPAGVKFPGALGPGIEVIQQHHRYAVVHPSWNPKSRSTYETYDEREDDGRHRISPAVFAPDDLPPLPTRWLKVRPLGKATSTAKSATLDKAADLSDDEVRAWFAEHRGTMCRAVRKVLALESANLTAAVQDGTSRYDTARDGVMAIVRLGAEGHLGAESAIKRLRGEYEEAVADERGRDKSEWRRMVVGAVSAVASMSTELHPVGSCPLPIEAAERDPSQWPSPQAPLAVAVRYVDERWRADGAEGSDGPVTLHRWRGAFYAWTGAAWREVSEESLVAELYEVLSEATYMGAAVNPTELRWNPTDAKLRAVLKALTGVRGVYLPDDVQPDGDGRLAFTDGVLDLASRTLSAASPERFNFTALPYAYRSAADAAGAGCPQWLAFLDSLWPGDAESVALLQEWFGYVLSGSTKLHKMLLVVGPPRAGKGVISRTLGALVGRENVAGPSLQQLAGEFGLAPLLGKSLAVFGDARFSGRDIPVVVEQLLRITGEDVIDVNRKNKDVQTGKLGARLMVLTNEVPALAESSGALASRFVGPLVLGRSWLGKEDLDLEERIEGELGGILAWALDGLDALNEARRFTVPTASRETVRVLEDMSSPVKSFMRECALRRPEEYTSYTELYDAYREWARDNGQEHVMTRPVFMRNLRAAYPKLHHGQVRGTPGVTGGLRPRVVYGVVLRPGASGTYV